MKTITIKGVDRFNYDYDRNTLKKDMFIEGDDAMTVEIHGAGSGSGTAAESTLVQDLKGLLAEAEAGEFGDFTNKKYPTPKMALAEKLHQLRENVINGRYDG